MTDPADKMRQLIWAETEKERQRAAARSNLDRARLLGTFLQACLSNLGHSPADFARALNIEQELANGILEGLLPLSEIDDEFLAEIAAAVAHEPNILRTMAGRVVTPAPGEDAAQDH